MVMMMKEEVTDNRKTALQTADTSLDCRVILCTLVY